jgi:hypothetical protein
VRLEGLDELKKINDVIGTRTCNLSACSIVKKTGFVVMTGFVGLFNTSCDYTLQYTVIYIYIHINIYIYKH